MNGQLYTCSKTIIHQISSTNTPAVSLSTCATLTVNEHFREKFVPKYFLFPASGRDTTIYIFTQFERKQRRCKHTSCVFFFTNGCFL